MSVGDMESEYRLLASLIDYNDYILKVQPEIFTGERIALCKAIQRCYTTYPEVNEEGVERFYGRPLPAQIFAANRVRPEALIDKLVGLAEKRQMVDIQINLDRIINKPTHTVEEIKSALEFKPMLTTHDTTITYGVSEFVTDLQRKRNGSYKFLKTGLNFLDYILGGEWPRQGLTVILGAPGSGKSLLVSNSMLNMALLEEPVASLFISLEMVKPRLIMRLVSAMESIDGLRLKQGKINDDELEQVNRAIVKLQKLPMYIDDRPGLGINQIVAQMRTHKELYNTEVVFVDYLQIIDNPDITANSNDTLGNMAQQIRNAAVELDMAAVLLAQQNKDHAGLKSISGSSRVAQIADTVFEIRTDPTSREDLRICTIDVHKNRDGPLASHSVAMESNFLRFVN